MIEGLKVTIQGHELRDLCNKHADYHYERQATYKEQIANMKDSRIEGMNYTGGDPIQALTDRMKKHQSDGDELCFIADHIVATETYLLSREDLVRIGIIASKY